MVAGKHWHYPPGHPLADHADENGAVLGGDHGHGLGSEKARKLWADIAMAVTVDDLRLILHQLVSDLYNGVR